MLNCQKKVTVKSRFFQVFWASLRSFGSLYHREMNREPFDPESAISAARRGDTDAVARLIEHYRPYLKLIAGATFGRRLQPKLDESDLVQEASLLASRDLAKFRGSTEAELTAWLRTILSNVATNARRHYSRQKRSVESERQLINRELDRSSAGLSAIACHQSSPSATAKRREDAVILAEALEELTDEQRTVLTMREIEGNSLAEIAGHLGRTRNAVQKVWARAIRELRRILEDAQ